MKYKHLTQEQKYKIGTYLANGMKQKFIAEKLRISVCTISREKKQNSMKIGTYNAQELTNERKERLYKNRRFTSTVKTFVEEKKGLHMVSVGRIYQYVREDKSKFFNLPN